MTRLFMTQDLQVLFLRIHQLPDVDAFTIFMEMNKMQQFLYERHEFYFLKVCSWEHCIHYKDIIIFSDKLLNV